MFSLLAVTFSATIFLAAAQQERFVRDEAVQWTGGPFEFPCPATKSLLKNSGRYISKNVIGTRAVIHEDDAFVALPRFKPGVPVTLARVSLHDHNCDATLNAFPCFSLQEEGTCSALQNVVDVYLDPQHILWVLDTGVVNSLDAPVRNCPPKVVAFNLLTGKLVKTVDLSSLATSVSRLQYVVADYSKDGRVFIYVSDAATRAIIVYDVTTSQGYRFVLPQSVTIGCNRRDVLYLALLRHSDGSTCLVFTYLSATHIFSLRTEYLRSGTAQGRIHDLGAKPRRMVILGTDNGSAVFFRYEGESEVYRWDSNSAFAENNFHMVYKSSECSYATHVMADYNRDRMRVLESNFQDYLQGTVGCGANQALKLI